MNLPRKYRWLWLLATIAAVAVVAFAACDDDEGGGETPGAGETPPAGERQEGGSITVHSLEFQSLDPHYSNFVQDITVHRMVWRGLYALDKDNNVTPMMAEDLPDISADGLTYTITLKDGLLWSDGEPLTATDFEFGLKRTCNPSIAGQYEYVLDATIVGCADYYAALGTEEEPKTPTPAELQALEDAVGVTAVDDTTLEITLNQAQPTFGIILALWMTFPAPAHLFQTTGDAWPTDPSQLAYNGPYQITEYALQDHATLTPNPNWIGDIRPTLDTLTIKFIEDNAVADNAFRSGELDEAIADLAQLAALKTEFGERFFQQLQPATLGLEMSLTHPPLDVLEVRLALSQALNREEINTVIYGGAYVPTTTWLPAVTGGPPPDEFGDVIGFNPEQAKANLAAAGFADGAGFPTLKFTMRDTPTNQNLFAYIQKAYNDILGINIEADVVDSPTRSRKFNTHDFELFPGGWIQDYPDPENWIVGLFNTGGGNNGYECSDPEIDALIEAAQFNTDNEERLQQYTDANELIVTRVCGIAPYYHLTNNWLVSDEIVGMKENSAGQDGTMPGDWMAEAWGLKK